MTISIGCIIGSLSSQSINRKLVHGLVAIERDRDVPDGQRLEFTRIPIDQLPLYDYERDDDYPAAAVQMKDAIRRSDGVLIVTPEYNRSIPGVLKNAIDWASRPSGDNAFAGKPVGILGASVGASGTAMAQQHLRNILAYLDAPTLNQPEAYIEFTPERFDADGTVIDDSTRQFLQDWSGAFREWVIRFSGVGVTPA